MAKEKEYGPLLLSVRVRSTKWLIFGWSAVAVFAGAVVTEAVQTHRPRFTPVAVMLPILIMLTHPKIKMFENGIEIPPGKDTNGMRFLNWIQIDRYSWDDNRLILHGTQSVLSGGPVEGCTVNIPGSSRPRVDELLKTKLPSAAV